MRRFFAIALVLFLVTGCSGGGGGGGGGDSGDTGDTDLPPGEPAVPDTTTNLPTVSGGGSSSSQIRTPMTTDPGS